MQHTVNIGPSAIVWHEHVPCLKWKVDYTVLLPDVIAALCNLTAVTPPAAVAGAHKATRGKEPLPREAVQTRPKAGWGALSDNEFVEIAQAAKWEELQARPRVKAQPRASMKAMMQRPKELASEASKPKELGTEATEPEKRSGPLVEGSVVVEESQRSVSKCKSPPPPTPAAPPAKAAKARQLEKAASVATEAIAKRPSLHLPNPPLQPPPPLARAMADQRAETATERDASSRAAVPLRERGGAAPQAFGKGASLANTARGRARGEQHLECKHQ